VGGDTSGTVVGGCLIYDGTVTYEGVIRELFVQMPDLEPMYREQFDYMAGEELPYVVFGSFLIPLMETALESQDVERVRSICAYIEDVASSACTDAGLETLLRVEIGEWLSGTQWEAEVEPFLGEQTKRICRYVSGLATQRNSLKAQKDSRNLISRFLDRFK
jgi:hypothetical protein